MTQGTGAGEKSPQHFFLRLCSLQFLFYFAAASGTYLTVFLLQQGFQPDQVGFITAMNSAIVIFSTPFLGIIADKIRSIKKILLLCLFFAIIFWALIPVSSRLFIGSLALMYMVVPIGAFFRTPANTLVDAFTVQSADSGQVPYGHVRMWGSFGWVVMCFLLSFILPKTGVELAFYIYGIAFIPFFIILRDTGGVDTLESKGRQTFKSMRVGRLFKNYYFVSYILFGLLSQLPTNITMTFLPFLVDSVGGDTAMIGLVTGFRALLEIPALLLMRPLRNRFPLPVAILAAVATFFIEALLLTQASTLLQITIIVCLHGFGAGLMHGAATNYIYIMAPEDLASTAQTLQRAVGSIAGIIGNIAGGFLIIAVGIRTFYGIIAGILAFAIVYFIGTLFIGVRILKIPIPLRSPSEAARKNG